MTVLGKSDGINFLRKTILTLNFKRNFKLELQTLIFKFPYKLKIDFSFRTLLDKVRLSFYFPTLVTHTSDELIYLRYKRFNWYQ